ncbi:MAG: Rpn family recombination-promoting nuclease/putative transposase [Magnetococcales bacterium]|nr:Rpn family recombination-promoting nuclease/putative transposase [Magnetococcales bacterium]
MIEISQPHDSLFKILLSSPETAGALLRERLPPEVARLLAPEPPLLVEGTFVEENLRSCYSDRLFQARTITGKPVLFYVLIEHKSYQDDRVGWQLFRGISGFLEQKAREDGNWQRLPAVLPLLVYHGEKEWRSSNEFLSLIDADAAMHPWLVNFRFAMVDLGPIPDRELSRHAHLRVGLMVLKYGTRDPETQMAALEEIISILVETPELQFSVLLYLLTTFSRLDETSVRQIVRRVKPEEELNMMSIFAQEHFTKGLQEGERKGLQEGERKGLQEGEATSLRRLLQRRFGPLPEWATTRIAKANIATLETWIDRVLDARTLEEALALRN